MTRDSIDAASPSTRLLHDTHEVVNVARELPDRNLYGTDVALREAMAREGAAWAAAGLEVFGAAIGTAEYGALGALANRVVPEVEGALPTGIDCRAIIDRACPALE